jgi:hypothetical protein
MANLYYEPVFYGVEDVTVQGDARSFGLRIYYPFENDTVWEVPLRRGEYPLVVLSAQGQTEKHSARADVFRSSPKNGHCFSRPKTLRGSNVMEFRSRKTSALCRSRSRQAYRNRRLGAHRRKAALRRLCSIALSQASLLRGKSISAHCSAAAITQVYGHCAPLLIQAWTKSPADS